MRQATERGLNNNMEFLKKGFKVGKEDIDNIYLSEEELQIIYELDLSDNEKVQAHQGLIYCRMLDRLKDRGLFTNKKRKHRRQ